MQRHLIWCGKNEPKAAPATLTVWLGTVWLGAVWLGAVWIGTVWLVVVLTAPNAPAWAWQTPPDDQPAVEPQPQQVELLDAVAAGQLEARPIPQDHSRLVLKLTNKTRGRLAIRFPEVYAAIPLAGRNRKPESLAGQTRGQTQGLGGSFSDQALAASLGRSAKTVLVDGRVLLAAGKSMRLKLDCFCLELGRPDPHPRVPYVLSELEQLCGAPKVRRLLQVYGHGNLDQRVAQLAAWHLANQAPWRVLANVRVPGTGRTTRPFTPRELHAAALLVEEL